MPPKFGIVLPVALVPRWERRNSKRFFSLKCTVSIVKIHIAIAMILQKTIFFKSIRILYYTIIPNTAGVYFRVLLSSNVLPEHFRHTVCTRVHKLHKVKPFYNIFRMQIVRFCTLSTDYHYYNMKTVSRANEIVRAGYGLLHLSRRLSYPLRPLSG